jgi:hypothetical protein
MADVLAIGIYEYGNNRQGKDRCCSRKGLPFRLDKNFVSLGSINSNNNAADFTRLPLYHQHSIGLIFLL